MTLLCRHSFKLRHRSKAKAEAALRSRESRAEREGESYGGEVYLCTWCADWHFGRRDKRPAKRAEGKNDE